MSQPVLGETVCARCHKPLFELIAQFQCLECTQVFCKKHYNEHTCYVPKRRTA
jgi:hypothetical protein